MIEVMKLRERLVYVSKDRNSLDELSEYLENIFPDAPQEAIRRDKEAGVFVLGLDMGDDATKKDFNDMLELYTRMKP